MNPSRPRIFLSHTSSDKDFVRRLAGDLEVQGIKSWVDEAEIKVGDSLIQKITTGIHQSDYFVVVLSPAALESNWVKEELEMALSRQIEGKRIKVLPVKCSPCEAPGFLRGKLYVDLSKDSYLSGLRKLVESIGLVFNETALSKSPARNLAASIDIAILQGLGIYTHPFHRPQQYVGMSREEIYKLPKAIANTTGNFTIESDDCLILFEVEGNFVSFVEVTLKQTAPHGINQPFDPDGPLAALSISPSELELIRTKIHAHTYYDHKRKLQVMVMCSYDGGPISVGFSSKYYGM